MFLTGKTLIGLIKSILAAFYAAQYHVTLVDAFSLETPVNAVVSDGYAGAYEAVSYLISDWTPIRTTFADVSRADYQLRLSRYREMGCNLIRVWGGAFLEKSCFLYSKHEAFTLYRNLLEFFKNRWKTKH